MKNRNRNQRSRSFIDRPLEVVNDDEIPENFHVTKFIFTKRTITYNDRTIQLSNVTKIAKYGFSETKQPRYYFSKKAIKDASIAAIVSLAVAYFFSFLSSVSNFFGLAFFVAGAIAAYGLYERYAKKPEKTKYYGLIIETSSGKGENLIAKSKDFIWTLFNKITVAMNDSNFSAIEANFTTNEINYVNNTNIGNIIGDMISNVDGGTVISKSQHVNVGNMNPEQTRDYHQDTYREPVERREPAAVPKEKVYTPPPPPSPPPPPTEKKIEVVEKNEPVVRKEKEVDVPPNEPDGYQQEKLSSEHAANPGESQSGGTSTFREVEAAAEKTKLEAAEKVSQEVPEPKEDFDHLLDYLK